MMLCNGLIQLIAPLGALSQLPWALQQVPGGHPPLHGGGGGGSKNSSSRSVWGPAPPWGRCLCPRCAESPRVPVPWPREAPQLQLLPQAWGNWGAHISPWAPRSCSRDRSMVLAFALHLLGSSALLLAATAGAQGKADSRGCASVPFLLPPSSASLHVLDVLWGSIEAAPCPSAAGEDGEGEMGVMGLPEAAGSPPQPAQLLGTRGLICVFEVPR